MRHEKNNRGFTLIELMVVVLILGIIIAIGLPNFVRMSGNARRASCFSNQRNMAEQAMLYAADNGFATGVFNVNDMLAGNYVSSNICECPVSTIDDHDDYVITMADGRVSVMLCLMEPLEHEYVFPN